MQKRNTQGVLAEFRYVLNLRISSLEREERGEREGARGHRQGQEERGRRRVTGRTREREREGGRVESGWRRVVGRVKSEERERVELNENGKGCEGDQDARFCVQPRVVVPRV